MPYAPTFVFPNGGMYTTRAMGAPMPTMSVLDLIGQTPLVEVTRFDTGPCRLFLKLESANPSGSIKDRPARAMIEAAEAAGELKEGGTVVEATAGNTGVGLALVASLKGYRTVLVVPDKMSREKIMHARALGAEVVLTRSDVGKGHPDYYQDLAQAITARTRGAIYANQFENPANPASHEATTGPEILAQMGGDVDAVVVGVGSGGTLTGVGRYLKRTSPKTEMVLADPLGSVLAPYVETGAMGEAGSWVVEGIGEDFIPDNADLSLVRRAFAIDDAESFATARELLRREGLLGGSSSGTLLAGALRYCREQRDPKRVVTFVPDSGAKYLSKVFSDAFIAQEGWAGRARTGTVRDVVINRFDEGAEVFVRPHETVRSAFARMRASDISQLPVIDDGRVVGLVDESDLLDALAAAGDGMARVFDKPVREVMVTKLETIPAAAPVRDLVPMFARGLVPVVMDGDAFLGLVTRIDLINHFRIGER
jgi:cystathionine beta-synthase